MVRKRHRSPDPAPAAAQAAQPADPWGDPVVANWLQFPHQGDRTLFERIQHRDIDVQRHIHWDTLRTLGVEDRAHQVLDPVWSRLFDIQEPTYRELTLEFCSTVVHHSPIIDLAYPRALEFRLGGRERSLSIRDLATRLGLYTEEELEQPIFRDGIIDFPRGGIDLFQYWPQIGRGEYAGSQPKATHLLDPFHRILHRLISQTIVFRAGDPGTVTQTDMFFLWAIISGQTANVATRMAQYLEKCYGQKPRSPICGGAYITRLARSFGLLQPQIVDQLTLIGGTLPLDLDIFTHMDVCRRIDGRFVLVDGQGHLWPPQQHQQQEQEEQGEDHPDQPPQHDRPRSPSPPRQVPTHPSRLTITPPGMTARMTELERIMLSMVDVQSHIVDCLHAMADGSPIPPRPPMPDVSLLRARLQQQQTGGPSTSRPSDIPESSQPADPSSSSSE